MSYDHVILVVVSLGFIYWVFNVGVKKIMATLKDVQDSLAKLSADVDAVGHAVATPADLDGIVATVTGIDGKVNAINTPAVTPAP